MVSNGIIAGDIHDLVDAETHALDVVASWEVLCDVYRIMEFSDPIGDTVRLEEFKWIIKQMNSFLTKIRKKLMGVTEGDYASAREILQSTFTPEGHVNVDSRKALVFQKLRQRWVSTMLAKLDQLEEQSMMMETAMMEEYDG